MKNRGTDPRARAASRSVSSRITTDRERARAAATQRLYRARVNTGVIVIPSEIDHVGFAEALIQTGRLSRWDEDDRGAIALALGQVIRDFEAAVMHHGIDPLASGSVHSVDESHIALAERSPARVRR